MEGQKLSNYSSEDFREITPHDSADFDQQPRYVYCGGGGIVQAVRVDGVVVPIRFQAGRGMAISPRRINATGTTATEIVGLW